MSHKEAGRARPAIPAAPAKKPMKRIDSLILDRDGTVIEDKHYLSDPDKVELLPGAGDALARLADAGVRLFLATNQSGIGRGYFAEDDYLAVQRRLDVVLLTEFGVRLDGVAFCPHAPEEGCACRKPATGMWRELAAAHGLDPETTAMAGDKAADVGLGLDAGLAVAALVLTGKGAEQAEKWGLPPLDSPVLKISPREEGRPHLVARDLSALADWLLAHAGDAEGAE